MKIYTLGYQGLTIELYVRSLTNAGVGLVLDVREHAWSQRPAFVKSSLKSSLSSAGIEYLHIKEAGNPSRNRKTATSAAECLSRYENYLRQNPSGLDAIRMAMERIVLSGRDACLTCYERNPEDCHRSVLIRELNGRLPELTPIHLQPTIASRSTKPTAKSTLRTTAYLAPAFLPFYLNNVD